MIFNNTKKTLLRIKIHLHLHWLPFNNGLTIIADVSGASDCPMVKTCTTHTVSQRVTFLLHAIPLSTLISSLSKPKSLHNNLKIITAIYSSTYQRAELELRSSPFINNYTKVVQILIEFSFNAKLVCREQLVAVVFLFRCH